MRLNRAVKIMSDHVILVPYRIEHVPKYHNWMEDEVLREQTASIRLSLDEEYSMQQTWLNDENKCTFIVLDKRTMLKMPGDEIGAMIGDANLYLTHDEDNGGESVGEIGLMIAENQFRGKGLGKEIALCLIRYGIDDIDRYLQLVTTDLDLLSGIEAIGIERFRAVISIGNAISIKMFEKLTFDQVSVSEIFAETTLERRVDNDFVQFVLDKTKNYNLENTEPNK